ncbi:hypothetical protein AX17_002410 [Amanita inopinata Kibby_2008]|nr:hypothetical protein AX17_002410 [Amanita inopinata Kibby_2008]
MSSTSSIASTMTSAMAATSSAVTKTLKVGSKLKVVGIILAVVSGLLIGSSFVFKKKGLLRSQAGGVAGEGVAYLKSALWWMGMSMMIVGELCNFAAYAFVEAIVVTPLGALSVVICAILSSFFLNEKLTFFGWLGCALCILGSVIIALNGPKEESVGEIREFQKLFLAPGFLVYASVLIAASLSIILYFGPRYGKQHMLWYILVCSMIGGISVSVTTGLGAAIVQTAFGDNQFKYWFMYFLMGFVVVTLVTEVYYLNVALALFNTAMVTPTYYVIFTFFSMVTTIVLFQGLSSTVPQIITLVMAFLVICLGITILQMSKIDPANLSKLDRRSTILLQAARSQTETIDEKSIVGVEDPGMDALRGSFGTVGSIIRARSARRMSQSSARGPQNRSKTTGTYDPTSLSWVSDRAGASSPIQGLPLTDALRGMKRHQLYDAPVPRDDVSSLKSGSIHSIPIAQQQEQQSQLANKRPTIKFDSQDMVHQYNRPGTGDNHATHEHRAALASPPLTATRFPSSQIPQIPLSPMPEQPNKEADLVQLDSSEEHYDPGKEESPRQSLILPPHITGEHKVHSAPPAVQRSPYSSGALPSRKDTRELFGDSTSTTTLLTFPSVTDSARSSGGWDEEELEKQKELARERDRKRSLGQHRRYPRASREDDIEESESLWKRASLGRVDDEDEDGEDGRTQEMESPLGGSVGGIRLVQPRKESGL